MSNNYKRKKNYTYLLLILFFVLMRCSKDENIESVYYSKMDTIKTRKQAQLENYLEYVKSIASSIQNDQIMKTLFNKKNQYFQNYKDKIQPQEVKNAVYKLRDSIENRYIEKYLNFNDILFINTDGDIFYTVKRRSDYHSNIFSKELSATNLSQHLKSSPTKTFIDFQNYQISGEPAAFFVEPNIQDSELKGWFVLQFSINKINDIFSLEESLGQTGEFFLVNKDCYMLTDSRFFANSTILKKHLSEENINLKFRERSGHKLVTDYRGYRALTSFEVISVFGCEWLLIAKIDEDEVFTEDYKLRKKNIFPKLMDLVNQQPVDQMLSEKDIFIGAEVGIDEYRRTSDEEILYTHGVSTCTAFLISQEKQFSYLAHVSALDWLYGSGHTDITHRILRQIEKFDVAQNDKRSLQIILISPNIPDSEQLLDDLLEWGIFLSQIKFVSNPKAKYANLSHEYMTMETLVNWKIKDDAGTNIPTTLKYARTLGDLFKILRS